MAREDDVLHVAHIQPWQNTTIMSINADGTNISLFANGTEVGHLIYTDGHWSFAGNVDGSARALFDALASAAAAAMAVDDLLICEQCGNTGYEDSWPYVQWRDQWMFPNHVATGVVLCDDCWRNAQEKEEGGDDGE